MSRRWHASRHQTRAITPKLQTVILSDSAKSSILQSYVDLPAGGTPLKGCICQPGCAADSPQTVLLLAGKSSQGWGPAEMVALGAQAAGLLWLEPLCSSLLLLPPAASLRSQKPSSCFKTTSFAEGCCAQDTTACSGVPRLWRRS